MQIKSFFNRSSNRSWFASGNRSWLAAGTLALVLAAGGFVGVKAAATAEQHAPVKVAVAQYSESSHARGYSGIVRKVTPAVVAISTSKVVKADAQNMGMDDSQMQQMDPMFRQFFGDQFRGMRQQPRSHKEKSLGSGVIVSPDGYILTNNHVIDGATDVTVTLADKREFKANVIGKDQRTDIAVLKIDASNLPTLTLADSSRVEVGDVVLAVGNPFGVGQTVTSGIVSATGRGNLGIEEVEDFIQTDASINPGNSGGALVDDEGHLIGINTAIIGSSGGSQGIGFAVPVNMARHDMDQIVAHGRVERAYLGILPQDVTPTLAKAFSVQNTGALVGDVTPDSPAAKADLHKGDIILDINGQSVADANQLRLKVGILPVGSTAKLNVLRNGKPMMIAVKLEAFPEKVERASLDENASPDAPVLGISVENLTPEATSQLKLKPSEKGVVVAEVNPDGRGSDAGLRAGDVIQEVNHQSVKDVTEFRSALKSSKKDGSILLLVDRGGNTMYLAA